MKLAPDKAKVTVCSIIKPANIAFDETSSYWSAPKRSEFLGFSLVATRLSDYHWSAFRDHEGSTFTEKDRNKLTYRIGPKQSYLQAIAAMHGRTAWSDSDQAVRTVHSCKSWLKSIIRTHFRFFFHLSC